MSVDQDSNNVPTGTLMSGKRGLIMGVANNRSIAYGIAKAVTAQGAKIALTYQGDALKKRVEPLAQDLGCQHVLPCDVTDGASMDAGPAKRPDFVHGNDKSRHIPLAGNLVRDPFKFRSVSDDTAQHQPA